MRIKNEKKKIQNRIFNIIFNLFKSLDPKTLMTYGTFWHKYSPGYYIQSKVGSCLFGGSICKYVYGSVGSSLQEENKGHELASLSNKQRNIFLDRKQTQVLSACIAKTT